MLDICSRYKRESQQIDIHFTFIGEFPKEQAVTVEEAVAA